MPCQMPDGERGLFGYSPKRDRAQIPTGSAARRPNLLRDEWGSREPPPWAARVLLQLQGFLAFGHPVELDVGSATGDPVRASDPPALH